MSTLFDPDSACPFYVLAKGSIPGSQGQIVVTTSKPGVVNANEHIIGLCLTNNNCDVGTKLTLERDVTSPSFRAHDIGIADPDGTPSFYADTTDSFVAIDGNMLGIPTGTAFNVRYGGKDPNLGFVFDNSMRFVAVSLDIKGGAAPTHDRKRRSVLKRVEVTTDDGQIKMLTVENTMRAIVAWLDKMNQDHASTYSVDRLVWCEEQSSARSEKGTIRGWFKFDVSDGNKRKVVPNASDAIVAMEQITKTDFYAEMKSNTSKLTMSISWSRLSPATRPGARECRKVRRCRRCLSSTCRCRAMTRIRRTLL